MVVAILSAYASAGKIEIAGDQALNRARATVDKEQLYIQSVLFKQASLAGRGTPRLPRPKWTTLLTCGL